MTKHQTLHMETTEISPGKTCGEIISCLVLAGAAEINQTFTEGKISGIRWIMRIHQDNVVFEMPVRVEPVFKLLNSRHQSSWERRDKAAKDREQAERVAWRQLLRWIQAQVAMIQTGMVEAGEVFMPYMFDPVKNQTLFQTMVEQRFKALPVPENPL